MAYPDTKVLDLDLNQAHSMRGSSTAAMVLVPAAASGSLPWLPAREGARSGAQASWTNGSPELSGV